MLGSLVNVVAQYLREHTGNYMTEMKGPALKLLGLYGIQVSTKLMYQYMVQLFYYKICRLFFLIIPSNNLVSASGSLAIVLSPLLAVIQMK